jgi:hypothetical protein
MKFLQHIDKVANGIRDVSLWHKSKDLMAEVETENRCGAQPSYVYELFCLFRIVKDLKQNHRIKLHEGTRPYQTRKFPKSPALKIGWPRFHVYDSLTDELILQICAGTTIDVAHNGSNHTPDISFQKANASEFPTEVDLYCIYDAKYREEALESNALAKAQFAIIVLMVLDFRLTIPHPAPIPVRFSELSGFEANCILTNGGPDSHNHDGHKSNFVRVVYNFHENSDRFGIIG